MDDDRSHLSAKKIPREERLIFALDVPDRDTAREYIEKLGSSVRFYKVGLELSVTKDYFPLVDELLDLGKKVFLDLKFLDVDATVGRAVRNLGGRDGLFLTVHAYDGALEAAVREKGGIRILAVTVLTSIGPQELLSLGYPESVRVEDLVLARARRALELGCDGVISSGHEARRIREELGDDLLIVSPGIRPSADPGAPDEQRRVVTPREAFLAGSDYIVVGRPIRNASDPRAAAEAIQKEIADLFPDAS